MSDQYCYDNNCIHACCDYYGYCPRYSNDCYYYYQDRSGRIAGYVIGAIFIAACIIGIIWCYYRRRQEDRIRQQQMNNGAYHQDGSNIIIAQNTPYGQPIQYGQPIPYGQPAHGQPAYGQSNYGQAGPFGNAGQYGQQQSAIIQNY